VNVAGGFTGLAFQYASVDDASVAVYSGRDRTGRGPSWAPSTSRRRENARRTAGTPPGL
jgi:hypothetical protein